MTGGWLGECHGPSHGLGWVLMLTALLLITAAGLQDPGEGASAHLLLEALDGSVQVRSLDAPPLADPRSEGAVFARYGGLELLEDAGRPEDRARVHLHGGSSLFGWVKGGGEDFLELTPALDVPLRVQVDELASLVVPGRLPTDGSVSPTAPQGGDRLYVRRGRGVDQVDGVLLQFEGAGVRFEGRLGERLHPWDEVAALFIEDLRAGAAPEPEVPVLVELSGGGRLAAGLVSLHGRGLELAWGSGEFFIPAELVSEVSVADGSYSFLSDLEVHAPGPVTLFGGGSDDLGMVYPHRVDRNCLDGPLVSGGRLWSRGLGVHAPSRLSWRLEGDWARLRLGAAIDDSALSNRHGGSVIFRVLGDGEPLWVSPLVRGGDPVQAIDLSLEGVMELVLEVDVASEAFVSDRANWLRPILLRD